jgi:hypothetical protein
VANIGSKNLGDNGIGKNLIAHFDEVEHRFDGLNRFTQITFL